mgnify:CR=1 FL=1|jgi:hypothetical protein
MNNSMVAHLWANEKQESANGSNFYFEGESIYSYGRRFEVGRIVRNKRGEKAYLINDIYRSSSTSKHQCCVRNAIPTGSRVFSVGYNMSNTGNMAFVTSGLESIKDAIEKYKKARTELSYRDIWGAFKNLMDYIEFFDMGTPQRLLKKSANEWLRTNHELSYKSDKIKREHVRELKHIFQILLNHQALEVLGTVNVIVDEVCGEGTWIKYSERSERWRKGEEERIKLERLRKEEEARYKDFDEKLEEWKSGEINFLNTPFYIPGEKPNAWIRIKGNIIETSKQIKIGIAEARKLWRAVSAMHRGAEFRHGLVEDITGHQWSLNRYENDLLTAGCHRIAYNEMERIAKQLGWV